MTTPGAEPGTATASGAEPGTATGSGAAPAGTAPGGPRRSAPAGRTRRGLVLAIALGWLVLDAVTKAVVVATLTPGVPVRVLGDVVRFDLIRNPGSAFGLATGYTVVLSLVAIAVVVVVVRIAGRLRSAVWAVAFGLLLGGALGNLADRVFRAPGLLRGHVVDFVALPHWPVFNVADTGITVAAVLIVVLSLLGRSYDGGTRAG